MVELVILSTKLYAKGTFTGNYDPRGDINNADCWIGCQWGAQASVFWGLVNEASAAYIARNALRHVPKLLAPNIARPFKAKYGGEEPAYVFRDETSDLTTLGRSRGTKSELLQALDYMEKHDLHSPVLIGQANHIGRIALQAENLGINPIVPVGLPEMFDPGSAQPWTQGPIAWAIREAIGVPILRLSNRF